MKDKRNYCDASKHKFVWDKISVKKKTKNKYKNVFKTIIIENKI